jgi:hypothetical protein
MVRYPPRVNGRPCFLHRHTPMLVQALLANPRVEGFDTRVIRWCPWPAQCQLHATAMHPRIQSRGTPVARSRESRLARPAPTPSAEPALQLFWADLLEHVLIERQVCDERLALAVLRFELAQAAPCSHPPAGKAALPAGARVRAAAPLAAHLGDRRSQLPLP